MSRPASNPLEGYLVPFKVLLQDLDRVLEYVHPVDGHEHIYSYQLYTLLLRASVEFESVCKDACHVNGITLPARPNITHYANLATALAFNNYSVALMMWQPQPRLIKPLGPWEQGDHTLPWYAGYNTVKHNRLAEFRHASLDNVLHALGAIFMLLARHDILKGDSERAHTHHEHVDGTIEHYFQGVPFGLRVHHDSWVPTGG